MYEYSIFTIKPEITQLEEERQMRSTITEVSAQWQDSNKKLKEIQENNEVI